MSGTLAGPRVVLVAGSGGREHALAWRLARDPGVERVVVAPGNAGMVGAAEIRRDVPAGDGLALTALAGEIGADLVVVGPEGPLAAGIADALRRADLAVFGPGPAAARLESSKAYCREVAAAAGVSMADGAVFGDVGPALAFAERYGGRVVVKADGLAAGKGVTVCDTMEQAEEALRASLEGARFGAAGLRVVVERRLAGREASLIALCDETGAVALPAARDHKPIGDGDRGPNTGGMGAYCPLPDLPADIAATLVATIHQPVLAELHARGVAFRGALYAGLMLTAEGPILLEFNVRFGDPETQALLPGLSAPFGALLLAAARGRLASACADLGLGPHPVLPLDGATVAIVLAAAGYPGTPRLGEPIEGLEQARDAGALVFTAGVAAAPGGGLITAGGRVLSVVGQGADMGAATDLAYEAADRVTFAGRQLRRDIGRTDPPPASAPWSAREATAEARAEPVARAGSAP